jgi:hypothetical protein
MDFLKTLNLLVRFLLELCLLAAVGYWGFKTGPNSVLKIVLGIGLPVLIAVIWWLAWKLSSIPRLVLSLILLSSGAMALFASGRADLGQVYAIALIVNQVFLIVWKQ